MLFFSVSSVNYRLGWNELKSLRIVCRSVCCVLQHILKHSPYHTPCDRSTPGTYANLIGLVPTPLYHVLL